MSPPAQKTLKRAPSCHMRMATKKLCNNNLTKIKSIHMPFDCHNRDSHVCAKDNAEKPRIKPENRMQESTQYVTDLMRRELLVQMAFPANCHISFSFLRNFRAKICLTSLILVSLLSTRKDGALEKCGMDERLRLSNSENVQCAKKGFR